MSVKSRFKPDSTWQHKKSSESFPRSADILYTLVTKGFWQLNSYFRDNEFLKKQEQKETVSGDFCIKWSIQMGTSVQTY